MLALRNVSANRALMQYQSLVWRLPMLTVYECNTIAAVLVAAIAWLALAVRAFEDANS